MTAATPAPQLLALMQPGFAADVIPFADLFRRPAWMADAACAGEPPGRFFASPSSKRAAGAVDVCRRCAVRQTCLDFALEHDEVGIWGGTTDRERAHLSDPASAVARGDRTPSCSTTPCEREDCSEPATGRFCSQRCRSADGARRRRERRLAKAGERPAQSAEMAAVEAKLDEVFGRKSLSTPATG